MRARLGGRGRPTPGHALVAALVVAATVVLSPIGATGLDFTLEKLPKARPDEVIAWHDVNGDGRKDLVRQWGRELEVYLLGEHHHIEHAPAWRVEISPPWDLWDFADVRSELPGEELLALSPKGVGWLSFQRGTTSTAKMEILIAENLPLRWDEQLARPGQIVVPLRADRPPDLVLPSRKGLKIYRRAKAYGRWELATQLVSPLRPRPWFDASAGRAYLLGFGEWPAARGFRSLSSREPSLMQWPRYRFGSRWGTTAGRFIDWNGDGRLDWLVRSAEPSGGHWQIRLQNDKGRFDSDHPLNPYLSSERGGTGTSSGPESEANAPEEPIKTFLSRQGELQWENLADVNGDGRLDLVRITSLDNWAMPKTRFSVYLQTPQGLFSGKPASLLRVRAVLPGEDLPLADVDGDGDLDLLLLKIDLQVGSASSEMKAFFRKGIETDLGAYLWRGRSGYTKRPAWKKAVIITHDMFEFTREPRPLMEFDKDLTGDGRPDLVLRLSRDTVGVFRMTKDGFAKEPDASQQLSFTVERIECDDFDGDGNVDVFISGWNPNNPDPTPRAILFNEKTARTGGKR